MLKFYDGQDQFRFPFMIYTDFEGITPVDEQYREKMNEMKTEKRSKIANTEKINTHVLTLWYLDGMYYCVSLW